MLGQILTEITLGQKKETSIISRILQQNEEIMSQIQHIQAEMSELPIKDIAQFVESNTTLSLVRVESSDKIQQIFTIVEQFYNFCLTSQKDSKRCQYLLQEVKIILDLTQHYDLLGTLQLDGEPSSQMNLNYFKQLLEIISQQTLQYQNQQNINKFEEQHQEVSQQYENVLQFYKKFKELVIYLLQKSIRSNYSFNQTSFKIKKQHFVAIWTQETSFYEQFLSKLTKFFEKFITYDINDRQYSMSSYVYNSNPESLQINRTSKIIFDSNEITLHFQALVSNLSIIHHFFTDLQYITPSQKHNFISSVKKTILQQIRSYIQYLLPYLKMDLRRKLLSHLSVNQTAETLNIFQLLVSLRMCGKDADMLVQTIKLIIKKVRQEPSALQTVLNFIGLAKQNKDNYNMNFFVCNQMVEDLEQGQVDSEMAEVIKRVLIVREEMRMKIHKFEGRQ